MANTQTTVPLFVANTVLTANQQNLSAGTGVPVFATTVTRDAAFGGSNKVLAEGQLAYIEASNVVQYYDGAAWQSVGVSPGLVLVKAQAVGSGVATVQVTGAFSSTYDNYKILFNGGTSSGGSFINVILGATTTGYYFNNIVATFAGGAVSNSAVANSSNFPRVGTSNLTHCQANFELNGPNLTDETTLYGWFVQSETGGQSGAIGGVLVDNTQYTSFTFALSFGATFTGGTIYVYGYAKS